MRKGWFNNEIREITPEEKSFLDEQIRNGTMVSTEHPPQEKIDAARKWRAEHTFNEGLEEFLRENGYHS